jgi:hypothetical protein
MPITAEITWTEGMVRCRHIRATLIGSERNAPRAVHCDRLDSQWRVSRCVQTERPGVAYPASRLESVSSSQTTGSETGVSREPRRRRRDLGRWRKRLAPAAGQVAEGRTHGLHRSPRVPGRLVCPCLDCFSQRNQRSLAIAPATGVPIRREAGILVAIRVEERRWTEGTMPLAKQGSASIARGSDHDHQGEGDQSDRGTP